MDVREKLVELIANAKAMYADDYTDHTEDEYIAETLSDNFITVWDGKPIEAFLHPIDAYKGLKAKYLVFKADTGEMVDNCFILRPDKDAVAVEALRAYAKVTDNETLADDIYNWVGNGVTVQELDGCDFCQKFDFAGARAEVNKYGAHISLAICNTKFPDEERFKFCPMCGRRLPQPPEGDLK